MTRPARLLLLPDSTGKGKTPAKTEVLATSEHGIPIGWIFCFGGRNFLDPEDNVVQRHGTAAQRDPFTTPLDVAEARLANVISVLEENPHLWAWFAALNLLRQRLAAKDSRGTLKLEADWLNDKKNGPAGRMRTLTALGENYVHYSTPGRHAALNEIVKDMERDCPYIPRCQPDDPKRFAKAPALKEAKPAVRAATLLIGLPGTRPERFPEYVQKSYAPELVKLKDLPEYPKAQPLPKRKASDSRVAVPKADLTPAPKAEGKTKASEPEKRGFFGRLKALFSRS